MDGSGSINFIEFLELMLRRQRDVFTHEDIREIFRVTQLADPGFPNKSI